MSENNFPVETSRFERKYRCSPGQYLAIRNALTPYVVKDSFTHNASNSKYLVRSLYFDTDDYQLYLEKTGGNSNRSKFRIRTYSKSPKDNPDIRVEIKVREANLTQKYGSYISFDDCQSFIRNRHWNNRNDPVLVEFERLSHLLNLRPKTLVEYQREGFHTKDGNNIRITFDHDVKSTSARNLFPDHIFWQRNYEQQIVMEIKHQETIPRWLNRLIIAHDLKLVANSKFVLGIEHSRPDIIFPAWSHR
jgi:SPX domain protein involved in polyphosphate accumulation